MMGESEEQPTFSSTMSIEQLVPQDHPLRVGSLAPSSG
jgi:hypothetical protein